MDIQSHPYPGGRASHGANLGEDTDTTAAVCGQLAGAFYGASAIPSRWLERLAFRAEITQLADQLRLRTLWIPPVSSRSNCRTVESSHMRFPPLFGQIFSNNTLMDRCLVSSFRSRCSCIGLPPRERAVRCGSSFRLEGVSELRSRIGYRTRSSVGPCPSIPPVHPKCTSAGVCRSRLWSRRAVL